MAYEKPLTATQKLLAGISFGDIGLAPDSPRNYFATYVNKPTNGRKLVDHAIFLRDYLEDPKKVIENLYVATIVPRVKSITPELSVLTLNVMGPIGLIHNVKLQYKIKPNSIISELEGRITGSLPSEEEHSDRSLLEANKDLFQEHNWS